MLILFYPHYSNYNTGFIFSHIFPRLCYNNLYPKNVYADQPVILFYHQLIQNKHLSDHPPGTPAARFINFNTKFRPVNKNLIPFFSAYVIAATAV